MSIWKRALCSMLCVALLSGTITCLSGCIEEKAPSQTQTQAGTEELTLEQYSVTLYEGETYEITPKKTNDAGEEQAIKTISYSSDRAYIASCEKGVITALTAGQTYVHVFADGMSVALFVTVKSLQYEGDVFIRFTEEQLYAEIPVQARVYAKENGKLTEVENVLWSSDNEAIQISSTGVVTPLQTTESAVIKAQGIINGVEYTVEKTVSVVEPLYYTISKAQAILASTKTYTGEENAKHTQTTLTVKERNLRNDASPRIVTGAELTVKTENDSIVTTKIAEDGTITLGAKETVGEEKVTVQIVGSTRRFIVDVAVAHTLATVADMDKLSLASYAAPTDLALPYILTNDIDYANKVLYPIALWRENNARTVSAQWKYLLDYDNGKYTYVDRESVGTSGLGLTEQEWITFAGGKGINPANTPFTGIFDGNGYAIKNAKLMLAPFVISSNSTSCNGAGASVFGYVRGGTVRNVEFDISLQTPSEVQETFGSDLSETVLDGKIFDFDWIKSGDKFTHFSSTIIYYGTSVTVYNVYSHITLPEEMASSRRSSGICGWTTTTTAYNNVVYVENNQYGTLYYGMQGEGSAKRLENNLVVGVKTFASGYSSNACGENGNWWTDKSFSALATLSVGSETKNEISYADTLQSFDQTIWNLSGLSANEEPNLIDGCSVG